MSPAAAPSTCSTSLAWIRRTVSTSSVTPDRPFHSRVPGTISPRWTRTKVRSLRTPRRTFEWTLKQSARGSGRAASGCGAPLDASKTSGGAASWGAGRSEATPSSSSGTP